VDNSKTVNENWLVLAIRKLKADKIIERDKDVADRTGYSKEAISNMKSGRDAISHKFQTKFETEFGDVLNAKKQGGGIPVYDIDVTAGGNLDFSNQLPETIKGYINLPNFKNCIAFIVVKGDSMYPRFRAGDYIGIEPLLDMDIIQWGQPYVVLTTDNQRVLKYLRHGKDDLHITLKSENPNYDEMHLKKNKIRKIFMAKGPVRDDWQ
jgi:SOS-response transcriptional repressor LexA